MAHETSQAGGHHELAVKADDAVMGSERAFGITFAVVFALLAAYFGWYGKATAYWLGGISLAFLGTALAVPGILKPFNRAWFRFGLILHSITTPIILGFLFFITVTPIGLIMRLFGKRPLQLGPDGAGDGTSYWAERQNDDAKSSLTNQF